MRKENEILWLEKDEGGQDLENDMLGDEDSNHNQQLLNDLLQEKQKLTEL